MITVYEPGWMSLKVGQTDLKSVFDLLECVTIIKMIYFNSKKTYFKSKEGRFLFSI